MAYTVIRDTREKAGWDFEPSESCLGTTVATLKTGDYSLVGYEHLFTLERKQSPQEFCSNLTQSEKWSAFKRELERLETIPHTAIICEFPLSLLVSYPVGSGIPRHLWPKIRVKPQFLIKRVCEIQLSFKTPILFADGGSGKVLASSMFKRIVERYGQQPDPA